jgi:hypothetical protein
MGCLQYLSPCTLPCGVSLGARMRVSRPLIKNFNREAKKRKKIGTMV